MIAHDAAIAHRHDASSPDPSNVVVIIEVRPGAEAERLSQAAGVNLVGMALLSMDVSPWRFHSLSDAINSMQAAAGTSRPLAVRFGAGPGEATVVVQLNCQGEHGLEASTCESTDFSCDICSADIPVGSEVRSCRRCDYDVCSNCVSASQAKARGSELAGKDFRAALRSYTLTAELLAPGLPIPPLAWWSAREFQFVCRQRRRLQTD